ncbi:hypothetical protein CYFUS_009862 [Cystobacter fuscus]|uniref:Uncharacterized protein n=1 Tax=Cystobacter fuscus TaxID=43 RepID=A0A250JKH0_9BACT|nr:hypothetical protein [Cystobacter fuscus]ATB44375.1 hypothetical protein CYFUS_009862 [Cystobacter fuscus]
MHETHSCITVRPFTQWYRAGRGVPRELPGHPVRVDITELEKLLLQGRIRAGKEVMQDMGFRQMMWNAKKEATEIHLSGARARQRVTRPPQPWVM